MQRWLLTRNKQGNFLLLNPAWASRSVSAFFQRGIFNFLILAFIQVLIISCSFPRITVWEDPLSAREHLQLGVTYEQQGKFELAQREYEQALKELPEAHLMIGNVHFSEKNYKKSEKHYRLAIKKLPDNPAAYNNLAWLFYVQRQNLPEAERLARKAVILARPSESAAYEETLEKILSESTVPTGGGS